MRCRIQIVGYLPHGNRGGRTAHQQDLVLGTGGIMKTLTSGSHNNAEWMQFIIEIYETTNK